VDQNWVPRWTWIARRLPVLAEAPPPGAVGNAVGELHHLQQAFAVLGGGEGVRLPADTSIALVVNKWDRRGPAADHVTAFLDGPDGVGFPTKSGHQTCAGRSVSGPPDGSHSLPPPPVRITS